MNRIILAYAPENQSLALYLDQRLSPIGIPFDHVTSPLTTVAETSADPVMVLVTDQFLTRKSSMEGILNALQNLHQQKRVWIILADGANQTGETVHLQIDRMANVLHYMKHWQDEWIALSDRQQHADALEKAAMDTTLDQIRQIANQVGDTIGLMREIGYTRWEQLLENDMEALFKRYGIMEWHGQFRRQHTQVPANDTAVKPGFLPEVHITEGFLAPEPTPDVLPLMPAEILEQRPDITPEPEPEPEMPQEEPVKTSVQLLQHSVKDAWLWLEKGHMERGLELFRIALEQAPDDAWLKEEYHKALTQYAPASATAEPGPEAKPEKEKGNDNEAKSYELMGDLAVERGDYLFAKYCWDRVVELDPGYPNIFRKLGLMTAEHLRDYRETAIIYLRKALEMNPEDKEVQTFLQSETRTEPLKAPNSNPVQSEPLVQKTPNMQKASKGLVLITGATSGIGKATAEIFAQNGYRLILTGRRVDRLVALKDHLESSYNSDILLLPFDVRDPGAVEAALTSLPETFSEVDILVNNAGLAKGLAPIHEGQLDHWETMIDTNIKGLLYVTRLISPGMVQRRRGHIINVCSSAGREAYPNGNVYCATKFAVDALTKSIRFDLHPYDIRVSQVSPGHVEETEFALTRFDGDADRAKIYQDFQPLKSSDVADAIFYLATRPPHVNIVDIQMFATQQASSMVINRNGRRFG
ncbi:MAG TPA: SDR family NAD(P)-dependent oxidoreductase [Saprospiraceae bacterium]|nr:SDR family NAD(P)-dependent oxidoreductase [Saprospiraceae bacterium]